MPASTHGLENVVLLFERASSAQQAQLVEGAAIAISQNTERYVIPFAYTHSWR